MMGFWKGREPFAAYLDGRKIFEDRRTPMTWLSENICRLKFS